MNCLAHKNHVKCCCWGEMAVVCLEERVSDWCLLKLYLKLYLNAVGVFIWFEPKYFFRIWMHLFDIYSLCVWVLGWGKRCLFIRQRWANSVFRTEYEYEYYSVSEFWPNTNTNTIRVQNYGRIRIRILFGFRNLAEYEYEYYSECNFCPNTNTNT